MLEKVKDEKKTILLVEDDLMVMLALEQTLKEENYEVFLARNGQEAIQILKEKIIHMIISDQRMPIMCGIEVMKQAFIMQPDAIRIILTGNSDEKTAIEAINEGHVHNFFIKPWDDNQLRQTIKNSFIQYDLSLQNRQLQELLIENHQAILAAHESLRRELQIGAKFHETLLLGEIPEKISGISIDAMTIPSKEIDGDFYDFYQPHEGILDIVLGDVMGKGIPAAVVGTAVKTHLMRFATPISVSKVFDRLRNWQEDIFTPSEILTKVQNEIVEKLIKLEYFVCLFYCRFNFNKSSLTFVDCGSVKPIHYQAQKKVCKELSGTNFPLGVVNLDVFNTTTIFFGKNDIFVFYSDGISECKNNQNDMFGSERLKKLVEENSEKKASEILEIIKNNALQFCEKKNFDDDLTLIVLKIDEIGEKKEKTFFFQIKCQSNYLQLNQIRDFVKNVCVQAKGCTEKLIVEMQLIVNEAFANIVEHAYKKNNEEEVLIRANFEDEGIFFELSDRGRSFDPRLIEEPSFTGDKENGFGWHIIKKLADEISYVAKPSETNWNHLRIYKKIQKKENSMDIYHDTKDEVLIITLGSESLDAKDAQDFKQKVINLINNSENKKIVFDLRNLKFIDSSGLGSFLAILRVLNAKGGDLKLVNMNQNVRTMFELVSMHKIFDIMESVPEALKSYTADIKSQN